MIAVLLSALTLVTAPPPPLPDHPVTGKPVKPTWSYRYTRSGPGWKAVCYVPVRGPRRCVVTITFGGWQP